MNVFLESWVENFLDWTFKRVRTCPRYRKKLEYCPASGRYDRNTVTQMSSTVESFPTFLRD